MILSALLLIVAGILLYYNASENNRVEKDNLETVTEFEKILEQQITEQNNQAQDGENKTIPLQKTSININGYDYIGIIYIPVLSNLALPVIETCNNDNLRVSICKYSGSIAESNLVIAGHNYKSSFGKLLGLSVGNIAYFKDVNGVVYKYHCKAIETLAPNKVYEMQTGDWDLTLFTCTYNGANREAYRFELD